MNILQNMTTFYNHLPPDSTYRNVCGGILSNLEEAACGTIYEIAEMTNSSRTTIWRMIQKMGYRSFSEFHYELKQAVEQYTYYNRILPAELSTSPEKAKDSLLWQLINAYDQVKGTVDTQGIEKIAKELRVADKVRFYAPFHSSSIYSLQQNLAMTGVETGYYCLVPDMLQDCQMLTSKSIVFVSTIDHIETMDLSEVFENIRKKKAKIFGIENGNSKYKKFIDCELISNNSPGFVKNMMVFELYFYLLSEVYRMKYIQ